MMEKRKNTGISGEEGEGVMGWYLVKLKDTLCSSCGACIPVCNKEIFKVVDGVVMIGANAKECNGCNKCKSACDTGAIVVT